jgi:adenylate kinase
VNLVLFGPQGAGKGTQAARLAEKYDLAAISTGDMFRWAISQDTEVGREAEEFVSSGRLVPNELTLEVLRQRLDAEASRGFVLDGFPRNPSQAKSLDHLLEQRGGLDAVIVLEVPEAVSLRRIVGRRVCASCGRNYHVDAPPANDWTCDRCGGEVQRRGDDDEANVRRRLQIYHEQTEPLKSFYEGRGVLRRVDGVGTPDEVFDRIVAVL